VSKDALFKRIEGRYNLMSGAEVVVCEVAAALQLAPSKLPVITLKAGSAYDYAALPKLLVQLGYVREYSVESKGAFAVRGDILDIYPVTGENPVRIDFFGDTVERIRPYDFVSGERLADIGEVTLAPAVDCFITESEVSGLTEKLNRALRECKSEAAFKRLHTVCGEVAGKLAAGAPFAGQDYLFPLLSCACTIFDLLPPDTAVIFDECKPIYDRLKAALKEHEERFSDLLAGGEVCAFSKKQMLTEEQFAQGISRFLNVALQTFTTDLKFFRPLKTYNLKSVPSPNYLNNVPMLCDDVKRWLSGGYRVLIYAGGVQRYEKLVEVLNEAYIGVNPVPLQLSALKDVAISSDNLDKGFI
ncbi:MAG: hypothetical protein K2K04_02490, partial [Clostridia bacterium]|nr:hypothetical protein [Clostridia bacterium]